MLTLKAAHIRYIALCLWVVGFLIHSASGQATTYTYTGQPFSGFIGISCPPMCRVTGSFTVSKPLPANSTSLLSVNPSSFSFSDGYSTVTSANQISSSITIYSTDADGLPTQWNFGFVGNPNPVSNAGYQANDLELGSDWEQGQGGDSTVYLYLPNGILVGNGFNSNPGVWTEGSCPAGSSVSVSLPQVAVNKVLPVKPIQVIYGNLNLTFDITQPPGVACQAQSNVGHLPVLVSVPGIPSAPIHVADSVASATVTLYSPGNVSVLGPCSFSLVWGTSNSCLLNGSFDPTATYVQWSTPGFTTIALPYITFVNAPIPFLATGPLSFWVNLSALGLANASMQTIVQQVEPYIHRTLIANLAAIASYTVIQDPGDVNLLVVNRNGMTSGTLPDGRKTDDIIGSLVFDSSTNPGVLLQGTLTSNMTVLLTGIQNGSYQLAVSGFNGPNTASQQVASGPITQGQMIAYLVGTSVSEGLPVQTLVATAALRADLNGDGVVSCADLAVAAESYGSQSGAPGFNAWVDLNSDGVVNLLDLNDVVSKIPQGCPSLVLVTNATFQSTLNDISTALQSDLIDNAGIANSLRQKIVAAQSSLEEHESDDALEMLRGFLREVNAQIGKHVRPIAGQVLRQDAAFLISQLPTKSNE